MRTSDKFILKSILEIESDNLNFKTPSMELDERLKDWINDLTVEDLKKLSLECIKELMLAEMIRFPQDCDAPYWEHSGDLLNEY